VAPPFASNETALVQRSPWIRRAVLISVAVWALGVGVAALLHLPGLQEKLTYVLAVALSAAAIAAGRSRQPHEVGGRVEVDERGLSFDGRLVVPRAAMSGAVLVPRGDLLPWVRVRHGGLRRATDVRVRDREQGRALLVALGFDASQRAATFQLASRAIIDEKLRDRLKVLRAVTYAVPFGALFFAVASGHAAAAVAVLPLWITVLLAQVALLFVPTRLVIGADGLLLSWCGRRRFIAYSEIAVINGLQCSTETSPALRGIQLRLTTDEAVVLWVEDAEQLYERAGEAVVAWWRREAAAQSALVARGGRDVQTWLRALDGIEAHASVSYRTASMAEELWRIVEDVSAPADARAGAAVALRRWIDDAGRARLHRAAVTTAHPRLRIAIESAASGSTEDTLATALAEVEAASTATRPTAHAARHEAGTLRRSA